MAFIDLLGDAGDLIFRILAVVAPLLAWQWAFLVAQTERGVRGLTDPTLIAGAMIGVGAIAVVVPEFAFGWGAVIGAQGAWDLTLGEFFARAARFELRALPELLEHTRVGDGPGHLRLWLQLAFAIWLVRLAVCLLLRRGRGAARFLAAESATLAVSAAGVVYLVPLVLWSINQLNVWLLLVLIVLIQDYRYEKPPLLTRLAGAMGTTSTGRKDANS